MKRNLRVRINCRTMLMALLLSPSLSLIGQAQPAREQPRDDDALDDVLLEEMLREEGNRGVQPGDVGADPGRPNDRPPMRDQPMREQPGRRSTLPSADADRLGRAGGGAMMGGFGGGMGFGGVMMGGTAIAVADGFVYVVQGGVLYQFRAADLSLVKQAQLTPPAPPNMGGDQTRSFGGAPRQPMATPRRGPDEPPMDGR